MEIEKIMNEKSMVKNAQIVNKYLKLKLDSKPEVLYKAAHHLIANGGKRLRPYMVMKSCQVLHGNPKQAIVAAGAVEMVHNFTLVHDDIMDNDEIRHGVPTVHKKFGMPVAILAGDVLFSKAYETISNSNLPLDLTAKLIAKLSRACVEVCEGQILDIKMAESKKIPNQSQYITMIQKKTAALFDVSCSMGAICSNAKNNDVKNMSDFGKNLGIAFQITDDLIGVMGDPKITKKPVGNDLREGKKSLPILQAIKESTGSDKKIILRCFGNHNAKKSEVEQAVKIIQDLGIEESVRIKANNYAKKAEKSLSKYDGTPKKELISLLDFVVKRSL